MKSVCGYAPGRVELLGNHTDYNQGVVLALAINRGLTVTGTARADDVIAFGSTLRGTDVKIPPGPRRPRTDSRWVNYAMGVVDQFEQAGYEIGGFDAQVSGDLPAGAGLSSSAAFEVATAGFLMALRGIHLDPMAVAKLCQRAENEFVGVRSGLLDQATSVFGRANHVVHLDFQNPENSTISFAPFAAEFTLVIADSGAKHNLVQSQYNARRLECAAAATALGIANLREITSVRLAQAQGSLDPVLYRRAAHVVGENERVAQAVRALQNGNATEVGGLMNASHESSRTNFENSTAELDRLVTIAQGLSGVLGSRLTGGGFGGGTVTLVEASRAPEVVEQMRAYSNCAFVCHPADGAATTWSG